MSKWLDDGNGCWAYLSPAGVVIAAYGQDLSKPGWFRGFTFDPVTGVGTHESMWPDESEVKKDIESWFDTEGKLLPYEKRRHSNGQG